MLGDQGTEIDVTGPRHGLAGQLFANFDAHLVAAAADGGSEVDCELVGRQPVAGQRLNCFGGYASGGAAPARVKERDYSRRVRNEDRDAVRYADRECGPLLACDVAIGFAVAKPPFPPASMYDDASTVHLPQ